MSTTDFNILVPKGHLDDRPESPFPSPVQGWDIQVLPLEIAPNNTRVAVVPNFTLKEFGCHLFMTKGYILGILAKRYD